MNNETAADQRGVEDGVRDNNIVSFLVETCGAVTSVAKDFFYIDDGAGALDFSRFRAGYSELACRKSKETYS